MQKDTCTTIINTSNFLIDGLEVPTMSADAIQGLIDFLLYAHDDIPLLNTVMVLGGLNHYKICQGCVAGLVRLLTTYRDSI